MRPLIALAGSACILLGVHFYLRFAESLRGRPVERVEQVAAPGIYSAEITLTFAAQADEFSLEPTSLVFRQQGIELLRRTELVPAGTPLVIENIPGVIEGTNEFYFECVPQDDGSAQARAVRVRLLRDDVVVSETTLWSDPGQVPRGKIVLEVMPPAEATDDHIK